MLPFGDLFRATVVKADIQVHIPDLFPLQFEDAADHAVGAGVLGAQVQDQGLVILALEEV